MCDNFLHFFITFLSHFFSTFADVIKNSFQLSMARKKTAQLVQLYERKTKNGITYYLHYSINGEQIRENTHLHLSGDKAADAVVKRAAQMLQADKTAEILSNRTGIATQTKRNTILLADYCDKLSHRLDGAKDRTSDYTKLCQIKKVAQYIRETEPKLKLCNVTKSFCQKIADTIQEKTDITRNTKATHFLRFVWVLNCAVKEELLQTNPAAHIENRPRPKTNERSYLTESELKDFAAAPTRTKKETLAKSAFLFSCLTGLRFSDVVRLTADNIEETADGLRLKIETKKTKKYISFILPPECSAVIRERLAVAGAAGLLFPMPDPTYINEILGRLAESVKIEKKVTFHTARHTFATLLLTKGADLYTVSSLLGHSDVKVTQVYAKIIDKKKDETVNLLKGVL